ncbi:TonB-dependent receptor [Olivibacter sp. SDN3]|uniref:SusC/RagA family TonB-linked outer membrane protein n=1 Tax=Olivibacter sp. SDN3 TaxID=2764720 RepID=UPI0016515AF2|nr:TonB-dependent receptor [Olivibacter sp. SDN3]QNL50468.1 TonB-dependent receptor [Olivibacter sp. SDN3]
MIKGILALLLVTALQSNASSFAQKKVTLDVKDAPLRQVLYQITKQTGYDFISEAHILSKVKPISLEVVDYPLREVIGQLLDEELFEVTYGNDRTIIIREKPERRISVQQDIPVQGTVTDKAGEPLAGVSISLLSNAKHGTRTDENGSFTLTAPINSILVISYLGFQRQEVALNNQQEIKIILEEDAAALDEVVVVGYGSQSRRNVTGAVSTVNQAAIKDLPVTSVDQKLSGQMAGVQVNQASGTPGGGMVIRVRGAGSIGAGDDPLYVVDGFPINNSYDKTQNPLSTLNPDDIESISVLKDAASTAIYGSRGSNGVVLITTKKGKEGLSTVDFNIYTGIQQIPSTRKLDMMTAEEYANWRVEHRRDLAAFNNTPFDESSIPEPYRNPVALGRGTNWLDEMTRVAPMQNYNVTISNGNEKTRIMASGGYFNQQGVVRNTGFERYSVRMNLETNLAKNLTLGLNLAPTYTNRKLAEAEGHFTDAVLTQALLTTPVADVRLADGSFNPMITSPDAFENSNPLNVLENTKRKSTNVRALFNTYLNWEILPGLSFKSSFNVDWQDNKFDFFQPSYVGAFRNPPPQPAIGRFDSNVVLNWLNENTLNYTKNWGDHQLDALAGFTVQQERGEWNRVDGSEYPNDVVQTINAATVLTSDGDVQKWQLLSYLARVNYVFKDKYLLSGTIRRDGSSRFGQNNRWGTFPSGSIGWRLSEEDFFPDVPHIDDLKLRASYGIAGNNAIGNYTAIPLITQSNYAFGGSLANGVNLNSLANMNLGWESSKQMDIGFDLSLFKGRLNVVAEYYTRNTKQMLQTIDVPISSGFSQAITNLGNVRNRGWEFSINSLNTTGDFKWETDFNISFNRNQVLDIGNNERIITGVANGTNITVVGQPMGMFYGYVSEGLFLTQAELDAYPHVSGQVIGTVRYRDVDGNGIINANDQTIIGNPHPDFIFGMTNRFRYKNVDLSVLVNGSYGAQILDQYKQFTTNLDGVFNVEREVMDRYRSPENPGAGILPTTVSNTNLARDFRPSHWVKDASYIALRNVTLGYNFKTSFSRAMRVYLSAQNAFFITPYKGGNPEVSFEGSDSLAPGVNFTAYPVPATYTLGINFGI